MRASAHHKTSNECECAPEKTVMRVRTTKKTAMRVSARHKKSTPQIKVVRVSARHNK